MNADKPDSENSKMTFGCIFLKNSNFYYPANKVLLLQKIPAISYTETVMTRQTRRIIFYSFVCIFIFATPPIILYSMGYSYDWESNDLIQTGGLYLKSIPDQAQIFINSENKKTSPRLISHLLPKTYNVALTKDGCFPWQKNLTVSPKMVTEARNIILFPQNIAPELLDNKFAGSLHEYFMPAKDRNDLAKAAEVASTSAAWIYRDANLFYLSEENLMLYRTDLNGFYREQISKNPVPRGKYTIVAKNSRLALLSQTGDLYFLNKEGLLKKISSDVKDTDFSSDGKKLLWSTGNEIWVQWLEEFLTQPYRQANEKEMITRYANPISSAIFFPDNEHLAFVVGDQIKVTELDGRDRRNTVDLLSAKAPQIYFDETENYFYYLADTNLYRFKSDF